MAKRSSIARVGLFYGHTAFIDGEKLTKLANAEGKRRMGEKGGVKKTECYEANNKRKWIIMVHLFELIWAHHRCARQKMHIAARPDPEMHRKIGKVKGKLSDGNVFNVQTRARPIHLSRPLFEQGGKYESNTIFGVYSLRWCIMRRCKSWIDEYTIQ